MRISFAANHGEIGGGEVMLLAMAEAARDLGHGVEVVAPPGRLLIASQEEGHRTVPIHCDGTLSYLQALRRWARAEHPEVLWCNGLKPAVATLLLPRRIVHLHSLPTGPLRLLSAVATRRTLKVVVPSQWLNRELGGKHYVLPNWTAELSRTHHGAPVNRDGPVRLGFLGRMTSEKGAKVLADAVAQLNRTEPRAFEVVVGGAPRFNRPDDADQAQAALKGLDPPATFLGWVERTDFFGRIDLAVFPSVFPESFGLVAAESMGVGCPFVITDAGALPEVTDHDPNFVARAGNADSLASAIRAAVAHYTAGRIQRSQERWDELYSPAAGRARIADLLTSLEARS